MPLNVDEYLSAPGVKSPTNFNITNIIYRRVPASLNVLLVFESGRENMSVSVQYANIVWLMVYGRRVWVDGTWPGEEVSQMINPRPAASS